MDSYIAKIKNDAESLIKTIFPAKALELDTAISVIFFYLNIFQQKLLKSIFKSKEFSTSEISNIFDINDLPKTEDFLHTVGGSNIGLENSDLNQADKNQKENYDETNQIQVKFSR